MHGTDRRGGTRDAIGGEAPATRPTTEAPATRPGFDLAATVARLEALHISIAGTAAEHRASELLNYHRIEDGIARCMRAHRRPYRKPPFVSFYRDFVDADFGIGNGGARIIDSLTTSTRRWELNVIGGARLARAGADNRKVRPADVGVLNECAKPFEYRGYTDFDPPAGTYWLSGFHDLMEPIDRDATVVTAWHGYDDCMTAGTATSLASIGPTSCSGRPSSSRIHPSTARRPARRGIAPWPSRRPSSPPTPSSPPPGLRGGDAPRGRRARRMAGPASNRTAGNPAGLAPAGGHSGQDPAVAHGFVRELRALAHIP